jgi:hypothetical protein
VLHRCHNCNHNSNEYSIEYTSLYYLIHSSNVFEHRQSAQWSFRKRSVWKCPAGIEWGIYGASENFFSERACFCCYTEVEYVSSGVAQRVVMDFWRE